MIHSLVLFIFLLKEQPPFRRILLTEVAPFPKNVKNLEVVPPGVSLRTTGRCDLGVLGMNSMLIGDGSISSVFHYCVIRYRYD